MFIVGLMLLIAGACLVYGTTFITRLVPGMGQKYEVRVKLMGLTCAVVGAMMIVNNEIPRYLEWIRVLEWIKIF